MGDAAKGDSPGDAAQWWHKPFSMLQTNLREIDADMSVEQVADFVSGHGATAWLVGVGGIQAQYPTQLPFHARNSLVATRRASGDLVLDALTAARARNLRLLARMDFSKVSAETAAEHPDWCYVGPPQPSSPAGTGPLQKHTGGLVSVCPCAPYYQERVFDILDEVVRRYPLDGFFVNWASMNEVDYYKRYHGPCHCSACHRRWLAYHAGSDVPPPLLPTGPDDPQYPRWLVFAREVVGELTARIRAFVAERRPGACLILGETADVMFHEANNAVGRELWPHATAEAVSAWTSFRPRVPVLVNATCFLDMPYRMASEEPALFAQYFLQCIARGGNPSTYMMGVPGRIPYLCLDVAADITRFHRRWATEVYDGLRPCAKTALVRPDRARMAAAQYDDARSEFRGLYSAMQELHVPFDVAALENLAPTAHNGGLARYRVIILPDLGPLNPTEVDALDTWVHGGGHLVTTGSSGVGTSNIDSGSDDEGGVVQLKSLPSLCRLAVDSQRERLWSTYFAPPQEATAGGAEETHIYSGPIVPLYGAYHLFSWKIGTGTGPGYQMLSRAPFSPPEKAYGHVQVEQRACGTGSFGRGRGVVIPFTVGRGYRELGLRVFRDFFAEVLRTEGDAHEDVACDIAEQVEVTLGANGPKAVVHLVNMSGARRQNFGSHLPIFNASITVTDAGSNTTARALVSGKSLDIKNGKIALPTLDLFEVIVIEGLL